MSDDFYPFSFAIFDNAPNSFQARRAAWRAKPLKVGDRFTMASVNLVNPPPHILSGWRAIEHLDAQLEREELAEAAD